MNLILLLCLLSASSGLKPIDMQDEFFYGPVTMVEAGGRLYVLSHKEQKIRVFDQTRYLHAVGKRGQGDGYLSGVTSLTVNDTSLVCVAANSGRVSIFGVDGSFQRAFRLEAEQANLPFIADVATAHDRLYVTYLRGALCLEAFDHHGKSLLQIPLKDNLGPKFGRLPNLHHDPEGRLLLFSGLDGSLRIFSGPSPQLRRTIPTKIPALAKKVAAIHNDRGKRESWDTISVRFFFPLIAMQTGDALAVGRRPVSKNRFPTQRMRPGSIVTLGFLTVPATSPVQALGAFGKHLAVIDDDGDLHLIALDEAWIPLKTP